MNFWQVDEDVLALFDDGGLGADLAAGLDQLDRVDQLVALVTLEIKPDVDDKKKNPHKSGG